METTYIKVAEELAILASDTIESLRKLEDILSCSQFIIDLLEECIYDLEEALESYESDSPKDVVPILRHLIMSRLYKLTNIHVIIKDGHDKTVIESMISAYRMIDNITFKGLS